jgi:hypothetical protein
MTNIEKALKLKKEELQELLNADNFNEFIDEVTANKGCGNTTIALDKFVVMRDNSEYHVHLSQLNQTVYHVEKHTAEHEIEKMLKLHLLTLK